tara:strand:- start:1055 stop:1231 length:177 start_codon:yes stop_codon:yes gene_type:complete
VIGFGEKAVYTHALDLIMKPPADLSQQHIKMCRLFPMSDFPVVFVSKLKPEFNPGFSS